MSVADWRKVGSRVRGSESGTGGIIYRRPVIPYHWDGTGVLAKRIAYSHPPFMRVRLPP